MSSSEATEPPERRVGVVILAAGQGTRMRSPLPKVLHPVAGRPMLARVLAVAQQVGATATAVVIAPGQDAVRRMLGSTQAAEQAEQLGTGHAVLQARGALAGRAERVLVLYGDTPLVRAETAERLLAALDTAGVALLTARLADPTGYGRILRDPSSGRVVRIVEQAEADEATLRIDEINSGLMAFRADWLWERLPTLPVRSKGEYYLTDLVEQALGEGLSVETVLAEDPDEVLGVNSQQQLARVNRLAWDRETDRLMTAGVTVLDPATTYVEPGVEVAAGTVLHPNTHLQGATVIGAGCSIGPNTTIVDSRIADDCAVWASVVEGSELEPEVHLGPYSHLRPGCYLERGASLGNFAEAKGSRIGAGSKQHHFSYVGDATLGVDVNIGAGTITCNYDGQHKHRTTIGDRAFIGSDSMLVAPVTIGADARTGAGSVVTRDVPDAETVVGVPARPFRPRERDDEAAPRDGD